ncbi:MAG: hypothetical protein HKN78_09140 [Sphingomonadaceae bacterium]|nr:hypothetical protein [Sphingomonadaceae bacterium]
MNKIAGIALAGTMMVAAPALAFDDVLEGASDGTNPSAAATLSCRRYAAPTGSRIGGARVCRTQTQWSVIDREIEQQLESAGLRSRLGNTLGKSPQCSNPAC